MIFTPTIKKAIKFSLKTHEVYQKQKRKGKDIPYITHPLTVGLILARAGASEDVVVAGILHDTIEDSISEKKVSRAMLVERFGDNVAELVLRMTEQNKKLSWEARKKIALENIQTFSQESLLVKSADIISNISELIEDYKNNGEDVWERFNATKEKILEHNYSLIYNILKQWPNSPLAEDLHQLTDELIKIETRFAEGSTDGFFIGKGRYDNEPQKRWFVRYVTDDELKNYEELGKGGSPLGMTFHMMINHSSGTYEKVAGYRISEEGIGKMINEAMKEKLPSHDQAKPEMRFTYILYKKKAE